MDIIYDVLATEGIESFLDEKLKSSSQTALNYRGDIKKFLKTVYSKDIDTVTLDELERLDYDILKKYLNSMYGQKANSTINRSSSCIESLYKHLKREKKIFIDISFFKLIPSLPNVPISYEVMPMEVVEQYIEAVRFEKHKQIEKKWVIMLAVEMGLRVSELIALKWSQFKVDGKLVYISGYGKGNKKYLEVISKELYDDLVAELFTEGQKNLFTVSEKNMVDMMNRLKVRLKHEDRNYTFHSLKKRSVTNAYLFSDRNILVAKAKGKHSKLETTLLYVEETDVIMTGYFSLAKNLNQNLYNEVDHTMLLNALQTMPKDFLFHLNMKLNDDLETINFK